MAAPTVMYRKKLSSLTSAINPYGPSRNARIAVTGMAAIAYPNSPSNKYLIPRSAMSSARGSRQFFRNVFLPRRHKYSESVPTGQSQLQKDLRSSHEIERNAISRNIPAGCMREMDPVSAKTLRFIREAIGSQPSTPGGLWAQPAWPPDS